MDGLISDEYREMNKQLHASPKGFGGDGHKHVGDVIAICRQYGLQTILDYGCGQGKLSKGINQSGDKVLQVVNYDPAIEKWNRRINAQFDLVVCTDVLEHVEPDYMENVLWDIYNYTHRATYLVINFLPANKKLPDGRNAHISQHPADWWEAKLPREKWHIVRQAYIPGKGDSLKKGCYLMGKAV